MGCLHVNDDTYLFLGRPLAQGLLHLVTCVTHLLFDEARSLES